MAVTAKRPDSGETYKELMMKCELHPLHS
jgi:hypothetical protein